MPPGGLQPARADDLFLRNPQRADHCRAAAKEVQYRFGERLAEIVLTGGRFAQVPYARGGEAQVAFTNGGTRYIVFSRIVRTNFEPGEPKHPKITDGVMVVRGGKIVAERICKAETVASVDVAAGERYGGVSREFFIPD